MALMDWLNPGYVSTEEKVRREAELRQAQLRNGSTPPPPSATGSWDVRPADATAAAVAATPGMPGNSKYTPPVQVRSSLTAAAKGAALPQATGQRAENAPAHIATAPEFDYLGRQATLDKEYAALNTPEDMSKLQAESQRRSGQGMNDMILSLAAQNAGAGFEPMQGALLKQAMAARDPLKYSGGTVNDQGDVIEDPGYKMIEQRKLLDQRQAGLDRQQTAALAQQEREANNARERQRDRELQAGMANVAAAARIGSSAAGQGKVMNETTVNKIAGMETAHAQLETLKKTFKPDYERMIPGIGGLENSLGGMFGTDAGNWWSGMQDQQNAALRELSGSAVTANEAARFAAAKINPNLPSAEITRRINQQQQILGLAREKMLSSHKAAGYRTGNFERDPQAGGGLAYGSGAKPAAGAGKWSVTVEK